MTTQWDFTLADFPTIALAYAVSDRVLLPGNVVEHRAPGTFGPTSMVYAPCCQRQTPADSVVDVRAVPNTIVRAGGIYPPKDHDWLCHGCLQRLYADPANAWTRAALLEARGAPAYLVAVHRALERAEEETRRAWARGASVEKVNLLARVREQVHAEQRQAAESAAYAVS